MAAKRTAKRNTATPRKKPVQNTRKKNKESDNAQLSIGFYMILLVVITVLLTIFTYIDSEGVVNSFIKSLMFGLFGITAYAAPFVLAANTIYLASVGDKNKFGIKLALSFFAMINVSAIIHLIWAYNVPVSFAYEFGTEYVGGGFLGACIAASFNALFHRIASLVILVITLLFLTNYLTGLNFIRTIYRYAKGYYRGITDEYKKKPAPSVDPQLIAYEKAQRQVKKRIEKRNKKAEDTMLAAQEFADDVMDKSKPNKKRESIKQTPTEKTLDLPLDTQEHNNPEDEFESNGIDEIFGDILDNTSASEVIDIKEPEISPESKKVKKKTSKLNEEETLSFHEEIDKAIERPTLEYIYPATDLLDPIKSGSQDMRQEMYATANKLIQVLDDFNVKAKLSQVTQGPTVTRYEIQPSSGIKLSKIVGLADDIALNLAVPNVLVAPVPGKAAVGIEIPNNEIGTVSIRELFESAKFKNSKSKLTVALGKDIGGSVVVGDIAKMPHVLIAGATGSGKSVCINTIITSLIYKASPDEVKLIMVDPKVVELGVYNGIPHLLIPVVTDPKKAAGALNWAVTEMMRRYDLFAETMVRNLEGYNSLMEREGGEKLPSIVIIIDELADLMMVAAKEVEDYICRLAQLARAAGLHLIIATQRPSVDVITGLIKANVPSRIAFAVSSQVDSRTILDKGGAEKLLGRGDMLYYPSGQRVPTRVQGAFVSDAEIERILDFLKETGEETHYSEDLAEHIERCSTGENGVTPDEEDDGDDLLPEAIELAVDLGQISTAMIQRRLSVGYSRAGRIIDQMESRGIISGPNGSKPRQVYLSHADLEARNQPKREE